MKAEEYFNSQADFNKWLKELTEHEKSHVIEMLEEYAILNALSPVIGLNNQASDQVYDQAILLRLLDGYKDENSQLKLIIAELQYQLSKRLSETAQQAPEKEHQKQLLSEIMQEDEKDGLYQQAPEPAIDVEGVPVWVRHLGKEVVFGFEGREKRGIVSGYHPQYGVVLFVPGNTMIPYHYVREDLIEWLDKSTPAPIICTGCGKSFNNVGVLYSHKQDCSKQSPKPAFFCLCEEENGKKLRCETQCETCKEF